MSRLLIGAPSAASLLRRISAAAAAIVLSAASATAAAETTVSLSFDDGSADQLTAKQVLADHGLHGSFFIVPGRIGDTNYLSWGEVASIRADGNEIGGHTATHPDLTTLSPDQQRTEICAGRQELLARGFPQLSFAYPFGHYDPTTEALVEQCGYASGRGSGGLADSAAESTPPVDRWAIRTRNSVGGGDTVGGLEGSVLAAEAVGGGWLNIVFHHVCDPNADPGCPTSHVRAPDLDAFLDWLAPRRLIGTEVKTVGEVITANPQSLLGFAALRKRRNGTATVTFYVGRAGLLQLFDAASAAATGMTTGRRSLVRPASVQATHAGGVTMTLRPSARGGRTLLRKGKLRARVEAVFTPFAGTSASLTLTLTLRLPRI